MAAREKLMMAGSNLVQVGGMLVMGPCEGRRSRLAVVVMMGDITADVYNEIFVESIGKEGPGGSQGILYDGRAILAGAPVSNVGGVFAASIGLSCDIFGQKAVRYAIPYDGDGAVEFDMAYALAGAGRGLVEVVRRFMVKRPSYAEGETPPPNDDLHFYGDDITVEVNADHELDRNQYSGAYPMWNEKWTPEIGGLYPTLAVAEFDESGKIKEILWQSR